MEDGPRFGVRGYRNKQPSVNRIQLEEGMPRFQELEADWLSQAAAPDRLVAKRYGVMQRLGRGSFGCVYLVTDRRAGDGEPLKVLKEIPLGGLRANETVQASLEARLLSRLHHPHILRFFHSFLEGDAFCIITEYCQPYLLPKALPTP
ncbi:unnamed protein product [Gadus morhua 'NCC']